MKIIAILGSPNIRGNGASALECILNGAKENGAECIKYELCKMNIRNCLGCRSCVENNGLCVLEDDFTEILDSVKAADIIIISAPIYINQINGYTKTFLDRCYPLTDRYHKPRFGKRKVIMLCTYGAPFPFIFSKYIKGTAKSLRAMGLLNSKNIIVHGCDTRYKVKNDIKLQSKLNAIGKKIKRLSGYSPFI